MQLSASDITNKLLAMAREKGVLGPNDHMPYIPEVMCQAASVCEGIVSALMKEKNPNSRNPSVWMMWSLYAGIGSVLLWHHKWEQIKDKGLVSALLAPKGVFAMDEYVTELTGCSFESEQGKELGGFIAYHARLVLNEYVCFDESRSARENMQSLLEAMKALFNFGMVYQMEQLGMK